MNYNFEWDPDKAAANLKKHGIAFERAAQVFLDPVMVSIYDDDHSQEEERWITLGMDRNNVLLVVIHTFRDLDDANARIRIISARKATKRESRDYEGA